jgi:hypothetical protein
MALTSEDARIMAASESGLAPRAPPAERSRFDVAARSRLSACDSEFVALAEILGVRLRPRTAPSCPHFHRGQSASGSSRERKLDADPAGASMRANGALMPVW